MSETLAEILYKQQHGTDQERYEADQKLNALSEQPWYIEEDKDNQWIKQWENTNE